MPSINRKKRRRVKHFIGWALVALAVFINYSEPIQQFFNLPDVLSLQLGQSQNLDIGLPFPVEAEDLSVVGITSPSIRGGSVELAAQNVGSTQLIVKLFGLLPIKTIDLQISDKRYLIPGGQNIGVALYTDGPLVVGRSDIIDTDNQVRNPARDADLRPGDVIKLLNGTQVRDSVHLSELVAQHAPNGTLKMRVLRDEQYVDINLDAVQDNADKSWRIGVWVRDSTAGIGTLTYYDPMDGSYGALGHGVTDADTGALLEVGEGKILPSQVVDVRKGLSGTPGELKGAFSTSAQAMGDIRLNTHFGIYGKAREHLTTSLYNSAIPIAAASSVELGDAQILTTIDGSTVQAFDCRIIKINRQNTATTKSMVIEITDPVLLAKTGGIVQGMSGSPIIQNGKLIGAVTHVFVNDPTRGHGLFIEWMLETDDLLESAA